MLLRSLKKLFTTNWHFVGVIVYFVLHGYLIHGDLIPLRDLFLLAGTLLLAGIILFGINLKVFRNPRKAGLFTSFLLVVILFYGVFQDFLTGIKAVHWLSRFLVFVPVCILVTVAVFIGLKLTKRLLNKLLLFVNVLLLLYILYDVVSLVWQLPVKEVPNALKGPHFSGCDTCSRPSVYLILLDEYMGDSALKQYFNYDNSAFNNYLLQEDFHIVKTPKSNYSVTMFSMASMLGMRYLTPRGNVTMYNHYAYDYALRGIRDNKVCVWFEDLGYRIVNYSPFYLRQKTAGYDTGLVPAEMSMLTSQTMWFRVGQYLPLFLAKKGIMTSLAQAQNDKYVADNESMIEQTLNDSKKEEKRPAFYYVHLTMPHHPYTFDSTGKRTVPYFLRKEPSLKEQDDDYLQFLVYTNKRMSVFISELKKNTGNNAVILLMSDHGFRFQDQIKPLSFQNFNAIYLPGKEYAGWYDGMTNVNQFRVLFNTLFHQQLPMLKDSIAQ
jgi:hypothetical protein